MFATIVFAVVSAICFFLGATTGGAMHEFGPILGIACLALGAAFYLTWLNEPPQVRDVAYYRGVAVHTFDGLIAVALLPVAAFVVFFGVVLAYPILVIFMPLLVMDVIKGAPEEEKRGVSNRPPPFGLTPATQGHF